MPATSPQVQSLEQVLAERTRPGELYQRVENNDVICFACGHRCLIREGRAGICKVRFNREGRLMVPFDYVAALQCDPIEKKPFFHALPGTDALSFGMLGCDLHCAYCQNWLTSQALRDPNALAPPEDVSAEALVRLAERYRASTVASTYNEPLITSEWAVEVFKLARARGFKTAYISNGNGTPEVLEYIRPWVDLYKVDLKSFRDPAYRKLGAKLENVLETVQRLHRMGFWLEIVTLIVPGFNDSDQELREIAQFLVRISPDIPWHVTAFHSDYKMTDYHNTTVDTLIRTAEVGYKEGLHFVYAGNLPGRVGRYENTYCPGCGALLIERYGFQVRQMTIRTGACPECRRPIPGVWN
jgi:pyruvate formate lyase activating enzyme